MDIWLFFSGHTGCGDPYKRLKGAANGVIFNAHNRPEPVQHGHQLDRGLERHVVLEAGRAPDEEGCLSSSALLPHAVAQDQSGM